MNARIRELRYSCPGEFDGEHLRCIQAEAQKVRRNADAGVNRRGVLGQLSIS